MAREISFRFTRGPVSSSAASLFIEEGFKLQFSQSFREFKNTLDRVRGMSNDFNRGKTH